MINLDKELKPIVKSVEKDIDKFAKDFPSLSPKFIALFCYPVDGFIDLCYCSKSEPGKPPNDKNYFNVGDFDLKPKRKKFHIYGPSHWYKEYWENGDNYTLIIDGEEIKPDADEGGDSAICQPFGRFFSELFKEFTTQELSLTPEWFGVQVDYFYFDSWRNSNS